MVVPPRLTAAPHASAKAAPTQRVANLEIIAASGWTAGREGGEIGGEAMGIGEMGMMIGALVDV